MRTPAQITAEAEFNKGKLPVTEEELSAFRKEMWRLASQLDRMRSANKRFLVRKK